MNKECPFKVEVKSFFDNGTQQDAGDTFETAMPAEKGKPITGALMTTDAGDVYKLATTKGEAITYLLMPENQQSALHSMGFDDLHVQLGDGGSPNNGAGFRMSFAANGPTTFIRIQKRWPDDPGTKYTLTFEGAAPSAAASAPLEGAAPSPAPPIPTSPPAAPAPAAAPPPPAAAQASVTQTVVEKVVEKPVNFKWLSAKGLKGLGIAFGVGLVGGLIGGFILGKPKKKPQVASS
jgi:hypothetical protein